MAQQFDPFDGIKPEIEFKVMAGSDGRQRPPGRFAHNLECARNLGSLEPLVFVTRERLFQRQVGISAVTLRLLCTNTLLNFKTLQLAGCRAGQIVLPYLVTAEALGRSNLRRKSFDVEADDFFCVDDLPLPERIEVGNDNGVQPLPGTLIWTTFETDDRDFLDEWRLQIVRLDFFGVDVFAIAQYDDFFLASGEKQIAVRIEVTEIASQKPAIAHDGSGRVRPAPVAFHHDCAAQRDFANAGPAIFLRRVDNLRLHALQRLSNGADHVVVRRVGKGGTAGFSEAIGLKNVDAQGIKIICNGRIETRSARGQIAHLLAQSFVHFGEKHRTGVDSNLAQ